MQPLNIHITSVCLSGYPGSRNNPLFWLGVLPGLLLVLMSAMLYSPVFADSPPNLTTDINWVSGYGGVDDIETAFNFGRRREEVQLGLSAGTIGTLDLPAQTVYDTWTDDQKALFIMNEERVDRAGMLPGVIGLPFTGIQIDVDNLAQYYADYLVAYNVIGHNADGRTPFERIDDDPVLGPCHEFLAYGENLAYLWTMAASNALYLERSIYTWIYDDSVSSWGHREMVLLQDKDLYHSDPVYGFNNNVGSMADEGYIGIGIAEDPDYDPFGLGWVNMGTVVVMNMIDPINTGTCPWELVPTISPTPTSTPNPTRTPVPTRTRIPTITPTDTATIIPTDTPTVVPTHTQPASPTPIFTPTGTFTGTRTSIPTKTPTSSPENTPIFTATPSGTSPSIPINGWPGMMVLFVVMAGFLISRRRI